MLIAGVVWFIAGANILNLGVHAYMNDWGWLVLLLILGSAAVFLVFDKKGYIMMAIKKGGGIGLRMSGLVPEWFIAFFYTGIGFALMMAGVDFVVRYVRKGNQGKCPVVADRG